MLPQPPSLGHWQDVTPKGFSWKPHFTNGKQEQMHLNAVALIYSPRHPPAMASALSSETDSRAEGPRQGQQWAARSARWCCVPDKCQPRARRTRRSDTQGETGKHSLKYQQQNTEAPTPSHLAASTNPPLTQQLPAATGGSRPRRGPHAVRPCPGGSFCPSLCFDFSLELPPLLPGPSRTWVWVL